MRVIIIGAGEVGYHIAKKLSEENQEVVLIDKDPAKIRRIGENLDVQAYLGSGTSPQALRSVGVEEAELLVAATDSDEANLIACLLARNLNRHMVKVARVRNEEYLREERLFSKDLLGVDLLINTRAMMVETILGLMEVPGASEVIDFVGGKVKMVSFLISADSPLAGKRLSDLKAYEGNLLVGAIVRGHRILIPSGRDIIQPQDLVYFVLKKSELTATLTQFGMVTRPMKNIIIVGAGETGMAVARALDERRLNVKIIDQDGDRCKKLAGILNRVIVIRGDGADRDLLREENAGEMDLIIALTGDEESNVLISLLARELGARRTITRVSKLSYMSIVSAVGLDTVINPRMAAVRAILQYIRRGRILSVAPLREEQAEAIEAEALETSDIVNTPLAKVNFPPGAILGAIVRGEEIIIPQGDTIVLPHDRIIIFALQQVLPRLEELLTVKLEYF
ncbi:MAG TPA: Trk system potassium transporter TrkA [Syntrophales bacterium]|jgi:trk system potassium uptake protein TrkA|nr:Trk system potassium transporter TrkA [Syntrophales bacterium]HON22519.1 Trk system potassium transporter TrkA [Syntrophales bacterium]HOU76911.1 Trk system potassium transporter TrkA [Syntrophales bacterium]HPC31680.1 Trk system potassium transporter TrkA [Syntrophales bacterium]HQG34265.1 Trk system potassium transporter TrkA [Syntrophales bacterium]